LRICIFPFSIYGMAKAFEQTDRILPGKYQMEKSIGKESFKQLNNLEIKTCKKLPALYMAVYIPKKRNPERIIVCGFEGKPFEKASISYVFETPYICIDETTCECTEQDHCLNNSCRFCKTTAETYARYHDEYKDHVTRLKKRWLKLVNSLSAFHDSALKCMDAYKGDPQKLPLFAVENGEIKKPQSQPRLLSNLKLSDLQGTEGITSFFEVKENQERNCQGRMK
jgi:hypothetical protein